MSRRAGLCLSYVFLIAACLCGAGCQGAPSDFNQVTLTTATPTIAQGATALVAATVANDTSNAGVSWTLSGPGTLTASTKATVTYNAPATVTAATVATVHASSVTFPAQTGTLQITVEPKPSITTTSLPAGNYGSPYTATVNAQGGVAPFTWTISAGSLTPGLALGTSTTNSVKISGTPTAQSNSTFTIEITDSTGATATQALTIAIGAPLPLAVSTTSLPSGSLNAAYPSTTLQASGGVPPFSWTLLSGSFSPGLSLAADGAITGTPTQVGTFSFTAEVTDSEAPAKTATGTLSITVSNLTLLSGNYAFEFNGFTSTGSAVAVAGSFTADGKGNLTSGVEDVNSTSVAPKNQIFTGAYTLGANNRGVLTFSSLTGSPAYSFALNGTGVRGRMIEFDSSGTRGSGDLEQRSVSTCTSTTFNGNYAFGLVGQQIAVSGISTAGPDVIVGSFTAAAAVPPGTAGAIGPGELDANTPVRVTTQDQTLTGGFQATSQATRCSMSLVSTVGTMNFSVYPVSTSESFLVETDTVNSTAPFLTAGTIQQQIGAPFTGAAGSTFTATSVAALTGFAPSGNTYVPDVAVAVMVGTASSSFGMAALENQGGTVINYAPFQANFVEADTYGRVSTSIVTTPFSPVFYMINQNTAFCVGELLSQTSQPNPFFGVFQPQSAAPFDASSIASTFVEGTGAPAAAAVPDISGSVSLADITTTTGNLTGTQDQSTSLANTSGQNVVGTYDITSSTSGTGTTALTQPATLDGAFVIVSPDEVMMITTTPSDTNPVVIIFEQ